MWSLLSSDVSAHEVTVRISKEVLSLSASPLPLLFLPSPSPLSLPSEGLVCSVSLLYRESLADDSLKTLPTEQRKQARRLTAIVRTHTHARKHTHTHQQTHTGTCSGCTEFASVILWVTERSGGDGRGIWKVEVIIFQSTLMSPSVAAAMSSAHLILGTSQGEQTDNQNNIERSGGESQVTEGNYDLTM